MFSYESKQQSSHQNPGYLLHIRDDAIHLLYVGIVRSHEIRIPINQPGFNGMSRTVGFQHCSSHWKTMLSWAHWVVPGIIKCHLFDGIELDAKIYDKWSDLPNL